MPALTRKNFLRYSAAGAAGILLRPVTSLAFTLPAGHIVGLQLYSIRNDMKSDPSGSLQKLAAMGYRYVEHASYTDRKFYGYAPKEFKALLDGMGLKMPSGHTVMGKKHWNEQAGQFTDDWKHTIEDAAIIGQEFVISPSIDDSVRKDYDQFVKWMDVFNKCGELCKQSGMRFGYHNHDWEFSTVLNNAKAYDLILQHTDPKLVTQQLDIGNMYGGGGRPMDVLKKYPGRFLSLHVKDEIASKESREGYESCVLGKGIINTKQVIDYAVRQVGNTHLIIEQESYQGQQPIDSAKEDLAIMKSWKY